MNVIPNSNSDLEGGLVLYGLDSACDLLGGKSAWVARHAGESCQLVNLLGSAVETDSSLNSLLIHSAKNVHHCPVQLLRWKNDTLLCASLTAHTEANTGTYMLCMLIEGQFELTERLAGAVDGLRCCLQAFIRRQVSETRQEDMQTQGEQPVACACCHRIHTSDHGWLHWDDLRYLRIGRGSTHTYCEKCALALYGDVLQGTT